MFTFIIIKVTTVTWARGQSPSPMKQPTTERQSNFRNGPNDTEPTQCPRTTLKMGSWNIRTLSEARALKKLDDALATLSMGLVALQEIRWLGNGVHNRRGKHCYDIYYS